MMSETYRERAVVNAKNTDKFEQMLTLLGNMETHDELKQAALMFFVPDMSYDRGDICLALKVLEMENHWGEYASPVIL